MYSLNADQISFKWIKGIIYQSPWMEVVLKQL